MRNSIDGGGILDKESSIISYYQELAEKNIRKKRGFIKNFFKKLPLFLFPPSSITSSRWDDQEVEIEYERLMKKEGENKLKELRPDIYGQIILKEVQER